MADNQMKRDRRARTKREHTDSEIARRCNINADKVRRLAEAGYNDFRKLRVATDEELKVIEGIGPGVIRKIREAIGGGD